MMLRRRVLVGVGRQQERRLLHILQDDRGIQVVGRCNSAPDVGLRLERDHPDVLLLDDDLHLLDKDSLNDLVRRRRVSVVVLVHDLEDARWRRLKAVLLPWSATDAEIQAGLDRAVRRDFRLAGVEPDSVESQPTSEGEAQAAIRTRRARVTAVFGGAGAPGRTTTAVNLLTVLGVAHRTVLVDLDVTGAAVAAHLRAVHPAWNILDVALARPRTSQAWDQVLEPRLQRVGGFSPRACALPGLARPRQRSEISVRFIEDLVGHLADRFEHVLLDLGDESLGDSSHESKLAAAAVAAADDVLVVATADPLSVHHAQLATEDAGAVLDAEHTWLVLNRCDRAEDTASSVAALKLSLAAVLPTDKQARQALAMGQPVVCDSRSRMRRPIAELAERIAETTLELPVASVTDRRPDRLKWLRPRFAPVAGLLGGLR
jgi:MinD-like ATPase involved in chromosome partitioning or flagellar assembly